MRIRLTTDPDARVCLESPYDRDFVEGLKAAIPWEGREWQPARKRWLVSPLYAQFLLEWCQSKCIEVMDDRGGAAKPETALRLEAPTMPDDLRAAFATLFVAHTAPLLVAEASWKALSRVYHPDNQDWGDAEKSSAINGAIQTIRRYLGAEG